MLPDAVAALRCPVCSGTFVLDHQAQLTLRCAAGHAFDAAKQGYFNLLTGKGTVFESDSAQMVAARQKFLDAGHYAPLEEAVAGLASDFLDRPGSLVLDAGTGTGHYLRTVLNASPKAAAIRLDISKFALRRAARLNPEAANLVWDLWRPLPVADDAVDVVMVVFAPRNPAEFARVLRPGGTLIVVTPQPGHLAELASLGGMLRIEEGKAERLAATMSGYFTEVVEHTLDVPLVLSGSEITDLAYMGPAGHHLRREEIDALLHGRATLATTAKFQLSAFTSGPPVS